MDNVKLAGKLREVAIQMRKESSEQETVKLQKCAKVLVAARGLNKLDSIIKGVRQ